MDSATLCGVWGFCISSCCCCCCCNSCNCSCNCWFCCWRVCCCCSRTLCCCRSTASVTSSRSSSLDEEVVVKEASVRLWGVLPMPMLLKHPWSIMKHARNMHVCRKNMQGHLKNVCSFKKNAWTFMNHAWSLGHLQIRFKISDLICNDLLWNNSQLSKNSSSCQKHQGNLTIRTEFFQVPQNVIFLQHQTALVTKSFQNTPCKFYTAFTITAY